MLPMGGPAPDQWDYTTALQRKSREKDKEFHENREKNSYVNAQRILRKNKRYSVR